MENDEIRMTNDEKMTKPECQTGPHQAAGFVFVIGISDFLRHWTFVIRHSHRSASIGSTRAARRAGTQPSISVARTITQGTATKVSGSVGLTSNSRLRRKRVSP